MRFLLRFLLLFIPLGTCRQHALTTVLDLPVSNLEANTTPSPGQIPASNLEGELGADEEPEPSPVDVVVPPPRRMPQ